MKIRSITETRGVNLSLIHKIKDAATKHGLDPNVLLAIAYKESRIRTGLTGDKNLKNKAHGIFQVRKPALDDVNRFYKTKFTVDDMKTSVDANIEAGALYLKMMKDAYKADNITAQVAGYNGGPGALKGKNSQANDYASSVLSYSDRITDIVDAEDGTATATSSKNAPIKSPRPQLRPRDIEQNIDLPGDDGDYGPATAPSTSIRPQIRPDDLAPPIKRITYLDLAKMNKIADANKINIGQKIKMPDGSTYSVKSGDTLSGIAKLHNRVAFEEAVKEATSSPGRVKRAGASCSGSVTELRALAKKHSGTEKGKMYHWCANMKGGKKESIQEVLTDITSSTQVFVDMDGVLADFFGEWKKLIGSDWRKVKDIEPALQKIRDTEDFWLDLPLLPQAKNLLGMIKDLKGSYTILSSPLPDDPNSEPHKREWIDKHLSFFPPEKVIITHNKTPYATNNDGSPNILIDDFGQNVNKWEAAGGVGFKHKDHKFERTAKAIQQHMSDPAK